MLSEAIRDTVTELGYEYVMAQVYPDAAGMKYDICVELRNSGELRNSEKDIETFAEQLDEGLRSRLVQYDTYRGKLLNACGVHLMKEGWADALMKKYAKGNATVAQVKVPVVISELPVADA